MQPGQELTHPVPTMALLQPSLKAAMCTAPCGWPHLPPPVSPFLLSKTCTLADLFWAVQHYQKTKLGLTYFMATVLLVTTYSLWANNMITDAWFSKGKYTWKWPEQCAVKVTVRIVNAPLLSINAHWWRACRGDTYAANGANKIWIEFGRHSRNGRWDFSHICASGPA